MPQVFPWRNSIVATEDSQLNRNLHGFTQNLSYFPRDHSKSVHMHRICMASHRNSPYLCNRLMTKGRSVVWSVLRPTWEAPCQKCDSQTSHPELVTSISIRELQQPFSNAKTRRIFEWLRMNKRKTVSLYNSYVYKSIANI